MIRTLLLGIRAQGEPAELQDVVQRLASLYRARLIVAQVRSPERLAQMASSTSGPQAEERILRTDLLCEPKSVVLAGDFVRSLCDKGHEADVIVVWRGDEDVSRALSAEDVSNVVRQAPRPIWLARRPIRLPERIVVAYDGSPHSGRALHLAANLAETLGARLTVLNVDESHDAVAQELILARAAGYCEPYRISMERVGVFGSAAASIHSYAESTECDLLVLGAAGVGYLRGLLFGSVTGQLIINAPCSVLVAK
jgi:nucleotide-binding universal stress UspA family protein